MSEHKCKGRIYQGPGFGFKPCGKNAAYEHDGKWFCGTHHPPTSKAKSAARTADRQAKSAAQAEQKRGADCYPELLAELQNIANADPSKWDEETRDQFQQWAQSRARAAIAKATGVQS